MTFHEIFEQIIRKNEALIKIENYFEYFFLSIKNKIFKNFSTITTNSNNLKITNNKL